MSGSVWYISASEKKIEFKKYPSKQKNKKTVKKPNQKSTNSSKKLLINLILASSLIFFLSVVSAAEINDTFHINLQTTYANGSIETGTFVFAFNITESSDSSCLGPIVYNHSVQKTTDIRGIVSLYLPTTGSSGGDLSALSFDKQYYLCYYRDGTLKDVSQLGRVPYAFRATQVNLSEISVDTDFNMTDYNITDVKYGFFQFLGSLANRITSLFVEDVNVSGDINVTGDIRVGGDVDVTGNVSASWFKGIFNWIVGTASQVYLSFNGTQLDFNETQLNQTIDTRISSVGSGLHVNMSDYWNTGDRGALRNISQIQGSWLTNDLSWINFTEGDTHYILITDETNLNVNRSEWWKTTEGDLDNVEDILGSWLTNDLAWINFSQGDTQYLLITDEANLNVNASDYWITDEGVKKNVVDILGSEITNDLGWINQTQGDVRYVEVAGDTMTGTLNINANLTIGTNALFVDSNNNVVGIGTVTPQNTLNVVGDINATTNIYGNLIFQAGNEVLDTSTMFDGDVSGTYNVLQLGTGVVGTINLENGSVTAIKIAPNAVNTTHIIDGTILDEDIASGAGIQWSKLSNYPYVIAGTGLTGGGQLSANRTISIAFSDTFLGWTNLTDYPDECPAGHAVRVIGDTLTCINISSQGSETLDGHDSTFFMPLNTSVVGNFDFNGGWGSGGFSIIEGDIYAQTGFFYNISSLEVTHLKINGSLIPDVTGSFDLGSSDKKWRDLWISRDAGIGGDLSLTGTMTSGTVPWARLSDHPTIEAGTGLEGGGDLSTNRTLSLTDTGVSAGGYGSTTINYPRFTVDAQGRITSAANQTIRTATTSVSGITTLTASVTSTSNTTASTPWGVKVAYDTAAAKASPGTCPSGQVVQNTTTGGVQCVDVDKASAVNGTGTQNTIAKFTGTTTIGDSKITDDGTIVAVDTSDLYINTTSGNVGIGTSSPGAKLEVRDAQATPTTAFGVRTWNQVPPQSYLQSTSVAIGAGGTLGLGSRDNTGTNYALWRIRSVFGAQGEGYGDNLGLLFDVVTDNTGTSNLLNVMTLRGDGNVGIGTITPQNTLNVIGDGNFTGNLYGGTVYSGGSVVLTSFTETDPYWTGNYTSRTGTGNVVFSTSPTLTTPNIGAATGTSLTLSTPLAAGSGGTGISSYTTGNYIRASGATSLEQRTPAEVRSDIGAGTGNGTVTSISQGTGMSFSTNPITTTGTINLADTAVTPGSYGGNIVVGRFTVDQQGRLTSASNTTIRTATTSVSGITTLTASVTTDINTTAATPWGVKVAYDTATAKASPGTCSAGQVVMNTTTGGVQCVSIGTAQLVDGAVTAIKIAPNAVNTTHIIDGTILDEDIASGAGIQWSKLSNYPYVIAGAGLTGGGQLSANRTISIAFSDTFLGWTNLTDYPEGCPVGQAVQVIGDTLECIDVTTGTTNGTGVPNYLPRWVTEETLGTSVIYQNGSNIGIGTVSPSHELNVVGDVNVTGTIYAGSIAEGGTTLSDKYVLKEGDTMTGPLTIAGSGADGLSLNVTNDLLVNETSGRIRFPGLNTLRLLSLDSNRDLVSTNLANWISGTINQINITDDGNGGVTLSTPQDIHAGATPTFSQLTLTSLTQGSVLFAGVNGLLSQDNSNFYWNNTSNGLGVGTNNPQNTLNVEGDANVTQTMYIGSARVFTNGNGDMVFRI